MGILLDIVKSDKSGRTNRDEKLAFKFEANSCQSRVWCLPGSRYENETVVDTENLTIEFNHYKKAFGKSCSRHCNIVNKSSESWFTFEACPGTRNQAEIPYYIAYSPITSLKAFKKFNQKI